VLQQSFEGKYSSPQPLLYMIEQFGDKEISVGGDGDCEFSA
jgi:hypothetical protein